jgi:ribA/ribD-fused uncharacterized protein
VEGIRYPTVEHAFQAQKTLDLDERVKIGLLKTPAAAKRYGRKVKLRNDWDSIRLDVMANLVYLKFVKHHDLAEMLLATEDEELVEGNDWGDTFWGRVKARGSNHLGRILMDVRRKLKG